MEVHEVIKRIRTIRGITQKQMAMKLHLSLSAYGKIERGESKLYFETAGKISSVLQIGISDLQHYQEEKLFPQLFNYRLAT